MEIGIMKNFLLSTATDVANKFAELMKGIVGPVLIVIGAAAAVFAIYLGVMYAKAEDANKRKEVQGRLIGAAIGVVIIMVGIALCYAIDWSALLQSMAG
jgi:hypothetical protein